MQLTRLTPPMLCRELEHDAPVDGWLASEKFDGVFCRWDGERLLSRNGKPFPAPSAFVAGLPPGLALDGELWAGRGGFQKVLSAIRTGNFDGLRVVVFDTPQHFGAFGERLAFLRATVPALLAEFSTVADYSAARQFAREIFHGGGEGGVFKNPLGKYKAGRSGDSLKFKVGGSSDEGTVQSVEPGVAVCKWQGRTIRVPLNSVTASVGESLTFQFRGVHSSGQPREALALAVRSYE